MIMFVKPLKHSEKYEDALLEIKMEHKNKKVDRKTLQPSKSYAKLKKEEKAK